MRQYEREKEREIQKEKDHHFEMGGRSTKFSEL